MHQTLLRAATTTSTATISSTSTAATTTIRLRTSKSRARAPLLLTFDSSHAAKRERIHAIALVSLDRRLCLGGLALDDSREIPRRRLMRLLMLRLLL